ncbi:hypothetical protein GW17_00046131 [Ensete ventricosum]|nr:hypothetical protein GW17_00046131 [Ensete ventricosum]RZS08541.1 hypothetical protein BHM03_00039519 [Ensete ventricosum]
MHDDACILRVGGTSTEQHSEHEPRYLSGLASREHLRHHCRRQRRLRRHVRLLSLADEREIVGGRRLHRLHSIGSWESLVTAVSSRKLAMASTSLVFTVLVGPHKRYPLFQASSYLELEQSVLPEHTDSRSNIDSFHQNKYVHSG